MLTGRQIRDARKLLRWTRVKFSEATSVTLGLVAAIESADGSAWLSEEQESAIRRALEAAGVIFIEANGGGAGVLAEGR